VTQAAELVYGRRAVREALRGRREVLELLATERAGARGLERKPKIVPEKTLTELAGTRDHQGVVARVGAVSSTPMRTSSPPGSR
jgi:tRNA G18 (ribose-2'-O)-methylase SpoU